jgi:hypothetical protein
MTEETAQYLIDRKAHPAPRVLQADVDREIASEHYFTALEGAFGALGIDADAASESDFPASLPLLTFCVLVLRNGFTITGESACASAANFDAEIGRRLAREAAVRKVWPLLGFRLRDVVANEQREHQSPTPSGWQFDMQQVVNYPAQPIGEPGTVIDRRGAIGAEDEYLVRPCADTGPERALWFTASQLTAF